MYCISIAASVQYIIIFIKPVLKISVIVHVHVQYVIIECTLYMYSQHQVLYTHVLTSAHLHTLLFVVLMMYMYMTFHMSFLMCRCLSTHSVLMQWIKWE